MLGLSALSGDKGSVTALSGDGNIATHLWQSAVFQCSFLMNTFLHVCAFVTFKCFACNGYEECWRLLCFQARKFGVCSMLI